MKLEKNKEFFDKFLHDFEDIDAVDVVEFNMGYVPFNIERVKDGEILQLNPDNVSYSFKRQEGGMGNHKYSWGRIFADTRTHGEFKPLGWVKLSNLESAHKAFNNDRG